MTEFVKKLVTNEAAAAAALSPGGASEAPQPLNIQEEGRSRQQSYVTLMTTTTIAQTHKHTVTNIQRVP